VGKLRTTAQEAVDLMGDINFPGRISGIRTQNGHLKVKGRLSRSKHYAGKVLAVPHPCMLYPGICLTTQLALLLVGWLVGWWRCVERVTYSLPLFASEASCCLTQWPEQLLSRERRAAVMKKAVSGYVGCSYTYMSASLLKIIYHAFFHLVMSYGIVKLVAQFHKF
jgi:hypothetical protein